ncbi:hypothetical protein [Streptomyces sp. NPDC058572]|uniref:hypothetical protein n=1 Tax=Streptomyces sp. NPDC058572 TaxID=3346546 RepID=UPI003669F18E
MTRTEQVRDTSHPPLRSRRTAQAASMAVIVVLASTFTYFTTNLFAPDRICHGWVTPGEASDALGDGVGRVTATEDSGTTCTIRRTRWLPGGDGKQLGLRAETERATYPYAKGDWRISGARHVMAEGAAGSFSASGGWTLLPASCTQVASGDDPLPVLSAAVLGGEGDATAIGRLLTSATEAVTSGPDGCGTSGDAGARARYFSPSASKGTDFDNVCGIAGFRLGKVTGPKGQTVQEQTSGSLDEGLYCDLSFEGDDEGPFARLAVVSAPLLVESLKSRRFDRADCGGRETVFAHDVRYVDPKDRAASGLPDTADLAKAFSRAAGESLHCT